MNRLKRFCALLLAFVLTLGAALPLGVGGVYAENMEQTEQIAELAMLSADALAEEFFTDTITEPDADSITEFETDPITEPVADPTTEFETDPITESAADITTEFEADPTTEPVADQVTEPDTEIFADSTTDLDADLMTEPGTDEELLVVSFYEQLMACSSLADFDALMRADENTAALDALAQDELKQLLVRVEEIYAGIDQPTEADTLLKEELLKKLNEHILVICPECGETDGHADTCSQYEPEPVNYSWAELTDPELVSWLMDEANADTVKAILTSDSEEAAALNLRIEAILGAEDPELALQLQEYLSALLELDEQMFTDGAGEEYIYFDLAAGNVTIGPDSYSGKVYVGGNATDVSGTHNTENKYYIYQSNMTDPTSVGYYMNTGYKRKEEYDAKQNCRVPQYNRVQNEGKSWGDYVTNNTDVKEVSIAWTTAAKDSGRTGTQNNITFESKSNYTADVTIDNIWSTHHQGKNKRTTGGIGANLKNTKINCTNTHIQLRLKGDNRVGCVHYSANRDAGNQIIFDNGETGGTPGSITVADFPNQWDQNYWSSAIGAADDPANTGDFADGIVINSGVIYAGTTSADDSTAIGGGGNNFGGVTITGGKVTAVTASTGTAIGGGIGWGNRGGDANVLISGGFVYAYNHGIGLDSGKYTSFVPAVAIGGGSADTNSGNINTTVTISGGFVYAQSVGGAAIGGGGSGTKTGGKATVEIEGGTVIAKSIGGDVTYNKNGTNTTETISVGVSIGGGTGKTGGGSVNLKVSGDRTILRTGSIGGGKTTGSGSIGSADVTITGGDITGQVIMAGGAADSCSFTMSGGTIHDTNVIAGNTITDAGITDPQPTVPIQYIQKDGGAVWMEDKKGSTAITGGTIQDCTAKRGGAIYMAGGTFTLSGTGNISGNTAQQDKDDPDNSGRGGAVFIKNGDANVRGGSLSGNEAELRGGGLCVNGGNVHITDGLISENTAKVRGGGVYLTGGEFTMDGGTISGNKADLRGGGIFLTQHPSLNKGVISGNTATESGGGLCINGDKLELTSEKVKIFGNTAKNGGGVAVLNGSFILDGGNVGVEPAALDGAEVPNTANEKGGGVYVANDVGTSTGTSGTASVTVKSGNIWHNVSLQDGGGVYLESGNFTMHGITASIEHNKANGNGGGIYLHTAPDLQQGIIADNTAVADGGGMYISDCLVTLNPADTVTITQNKAQNGAGIYISGDSGSSESTASFVSDVDAVSSATPEHKVGLHVGTVQYNGTLIFTNNTATKSGGAVCVSAGRFQLDSGNITVTGNTAVNGGGVAVLHGNFTMTDGSIGEHNGANNATKGGGVYVSDGEVWLKGGSVQYNTATDGGGSYVTGGRIVMIDGSLANNVAKENGGGAYVAGNFRMLGGTVGGAGEDGISHGNTAENGGGVYVNEGNVYVIYGEITHNEASNDGGGFYVSAASNQVVAEMLSGRLSYNHAGKNGGGMAVESKNSQTITVEIGCLLNHYNDNGIISLPIDYTEEKYGKYAGFDGKEYRHNSCPKVESNSAGENGGGFYLNSDVSTVSFYCVEETGNSSKGSNGAGMDVVGGNVIIGDSEYHNHSYDSTDGQHMGRPRGYISMENPALVNGGQVNIYGDMVNPVFMDEVTVDIMDKEHDYFIDHRRSKDGKRYKVHYIENFKGTGLYQAFQYNEGNTEITIEDALYNRPGYRILGWCTQPVRDEGAPNNYYYEVGQKVDLANGTTVPGLGTHSTPCNICGEKHDETLLMLYAIWEANGYTVKFDANVPVGDTYTGEMENQIFDYDEKRNLTPNAYKYPGHIFQNWNTKADGSGTSYTDEQEVEKLTAKNGATVILYAQWKKCDHTDSHRWKYDVINENKTLRRICDCGGQTLTATLHAEDTVYDGNPHPATLTFNDETAWGEDKPTIQYEGKWLEDNLKHETPSPPLSSRDGEPFHAGNYKAFITKPDGKSGDCPQEEKVIAFVTYTIHKADQKAPAKPTYTVSENKYEVYIDKLEPNKIKDKANSEHKAEAEYRLTYYSGSDWVHGDWEKIQDGNDKLTISMAIALANYIVEARYEELEDYNASPITKADRMYFFEGKVVVKVNADEGIRPKLEYAKGMDDKSNGVTMTLQLEDDYYLVGKDYEVSATIQENPPDGPLGKAEDKTYTKETDSDIYSFTQIPNNSFLTINVGKTRKKPVINAQVVPKQKFSTITNIETTITRDSAYTAAFQIYNYDPQRTVDETYGPYTGLNLSFGSAIPADTTVILLDYSNGGKTYWYYRAESEAVTSVPLTEFKKMGGDSTDNKYKVPVPDDNGYIDLEYQFIVDFSQSESGCSGENLEMTMAATVQESLEYKPPEVKQTVKVSMKDASFTFEKADNPAGTDGLTNSVTCTFSVPDGAAASKWDDRASALILTPKTGNGLPDLPPDARIKVKSDGRTTYLYKNKEAFIVPLSLLVEGKKTVNLTLESALFPMEKDSENYEFTAQWLISPSKSGKAPKVGYEAGKPEDVIFTYTAQKTPSLKSIGQYRILTAQDRLKLKIESLNLENYSVSADLLLKQADEAYRGTGWTHNNVKDGTLYVPLGACKPGSYCLMLTVKEANSVNIVMEVPYYFIVKQTQ